MIATEYGHHSKIKPTDWGWPNFSPAEMACRGDGSIIVVREAMDALQRARDDMGKAFVIASAFRSPIHNADVGGAPLSQHLEGHAFDVVIHGFDRFALLSAAQLAGFQGFGFYQTFLHMDMGRARRWAGSRRAKKLWAL